MFAALLPYSHRLETRVGFIDRLKCLSVGNSYLYVPGIHLSSRSLMLIQTSNFNWILQLRDLNAFKNVLSLKASKKKG